MNKILTAATLALAFGVVPALAQSDPAGRPINPAGISGKTPDGRPIDPAGISNKSPGEKPIGELNPAGIANKSEKPIGELNPAGIANKGEKPIGELNPAGISGKASEVKPFDQTIGGSNSTTPDGRPIDPAGIATKK